MEWDEGVGFRFSLGEADEGTWGRDFFFFFWFLRLLRGVVDRWGMCVRRRSWRL